MLSYRYRSQDTMAAQERRRSSHTFPGSQKRSLRGQSLENRHLPVPDAPLQSPPKMAGRRTKKGKSQKEKRIYAFV